VADGRPLFTIGSVARLLDVPPATIRTWEARYGLIVPARSPGGQRLYTREQIDQLRLVRDSIAAGRRPAEAHRLLADQLRDGGLPQPLRLLLVGRRHDLADSLGRLFGGTAFEIVAARDGASARALHDELDPALVVVDTDDSTFEELADVLREEGTKVLPLELLERPLRMLDPAQVADL
jgi:DNA-binding transcriptional MerR regulator